MALLLRSDLISRYKKRESGLLIDSVQRHRARRMLAEASDEFSLLEEYDVFLSHAYDDARVVKLIKDMLEECGQKVYVDWIDDANLDRARVTAETAATLRKRMNRCSSLLYLTSQSAQKSRWMPWELGYMDSRTRRVVVAPILDDDERFEGREYLGLYPYLDLTNNSFYVHEDSRTWVEFSRWLSGEDPASRS